MVHSGQATVTAQFTKAIVNALESSGLSITPPLNDVLQEIAPLKRVPMPLQDRLWTTLVDANPEPGIGLRLGKFVQPGHLDVVGFLLLSCDSLEDAIDVLLTYHAIVGEGGEFLSTTDEKTCRLIYAPFHNVCRRERVEAVMATLLQLAKYLTADAFQPSLVTFQHEATMPIADYETFFGCEVRFGQIADALVFELSQFQQPLVQANSAMYEHMRKLADNELNQIKDHGLSQQVSMLIREHPNWGKERIAEHLGMSGRHMNRFLSREGVTFKILSDQTRLNIAREMMDETKTSIEIALALGFHDESAFAKAFKRWTGKTPSEFQATKP